MDQDDAAVGRSLANAPLTTLLALDFFISRGAVSVAVEIERLIEKEKDKVYRLHAKNPVTRVVLLRLKQHFAKDGYRSEGISESFLDSVLHLCHYLPEETLQRQSFQNFVVEVLCCRFLSHFQVPYRFDQFSAEYRDYFKDKDSKSCIGKFLTTESRNRIRSEFSALRAPGVPIDRHLVAKMINRHDRKVGLACTDAIDPIFASLGNGELHELVLAHQHDLGVHETYSDSSQFEEESSTAESSEDERQAETTASNKTKHLPVPFSSPFASSSSAQKHRSHLRSPSKAQLKPSSKRAPKAPRGPTRQEDFYSSDESTEIPERTTAYRKPALPPSDDEEESRREKRDARAGSKAPSTSSRTSTKSHKDQQESKRIRQEQNMAAAALEEMGEESDSSLVDIYGSVYADKRKKTSAPETRVAPMQSVERQPKAKNGREERKQAPARMDVDEDSEEQPKEQPKQLKANSKQNQQSEPRRAEKKKEEEEKEKDESHDYNRYGPRYDYGDDGDDRNYDEETGADENADLASESNEAPPNEEEPAAEEEEELATQLPAVRAPAAQPTRASAPKNLFADQEEQATASLLRVVQWTGDQTGLPRVQTRAAAATMITASSAAAVPATAPSTAPPAAKVASSANNSSRSAAVSSSMPLPSQRRSKRKAGQIATDVEDNDDDIEDIGQPQNKRRAVADASGAAAIPSTAPASTSSRTTVAVNSLPRPVVAPQPAVRSKPYSYKDMGSVMSPQAQHTEPAPASDPIPIPRSSHHLPTPPRRSLPASLQSPPNANGADLESPVRTGGKFTEEESEFLEDGYRHFGHDWRSILMAGQARGIWLPGRTNVSLKDRMRIINKHNSNMGIPERPGKNKPTRNYTNGTLTAAEDVKQQRENAKRVKAKLDAQEDVLTDNE